MFPVTVIDNFFPHPDKIVDLVKDVPFLENDVGNYPGVRSDLLEKTKPEVNYYIATKLLSLFYPPEIGVPLSWDATIELQKTTPFTPNDPYNKKNRGWIHRDTIKQMTAIIYLDKDPDPNTGTNVYVPNNGIGLCGFNNSKEYENVKKRHYLGEDVDQQEYDAAWDGINKDFTKTISVENVYNRLLLFTNKDYHGVETYGYSHDRLTIVSFFSAVNSPLMQPLQRL